MIAQQTHKVRLHWLPFLRSKDRRRRCYRGTVFQQVLIDPVSKHDVHFEEDHINPG
jgi:hypothetical protein